MDGLEMKRGESPPLWVFPRWSNTLRPAIAVALAGVPLYLIVLVLYGNSPRADRIGYQPDQPVAYSHALHAGELGIDCRYCHNTVENASFAALPPTQTCMNCHARIRAASNKMIPIRESYASGMPIRWIRVHALPDFVYFDHSAHVRRGVGCVTCHGRIDRMEKVYQAEPLTMGWCLGCHRSPERYLRPVEKITTMDWTPGEDPVRFGARLREERGIDPPTDCTTCHR